MAYVLNSDADPKLDANRHPDEHINLDSDPFSVVKPNTDTHAHIYSHSHYFANTDPERHCYQDCHQ